MIYDVTHTTSQRYAGPVQLAQFLLRLTPAPWPGQEVTNPTLTITPTPAVWRQETGAFGLSQTRITMGGPISALDIISRFRVTVTPPALPDGDGPSVAAVRAMVLASRDLGPRGPAAYCHASPIARAEPDIAAWAAPLVQDAMGVIGAGRALMAAIHADFRFDPTATTAQTPPIQAFQARHGVCQDFAHIMIIAARAMGLSAAYVSGYLRTLPPKGQPRLVGADAMHAWVALWCGPDIGWVGFDPTNACLAGGDHIVLGMGRDYGDVAPLDGVFHGGGGQSLSVGVDVLPVDEASTAPA
ncbi:transglutaminase family protein [Novosphingobium sp. FSY-8]|uniref:Transglutaminase family protein n=1 Tax=Novosphingobium ovatum TaxID=1908523 RepID=A0ABW9XEM8_9SPHN|nr:transglutaminase family protein [Novosphingobium ovatum]NBC36938.1 transglutaminase family protein [Novosphingobium ovatum]